MKWNTLDVEGTRGAEGGTPCLICATRIQNRIFYPEDLYSDESKKIIAAWMAGVKNAKDIDHGEFYVCQECMEKVDPACWL